MSKRVHFSSRELLYFVAAATYIGTNGARGAGFGAAMDSQAIVIVLVTSDRQLGWSSLPYVFLPFEDWKCV